MYIYKGCGQDGLLYLLIGHIATTDSIISGQRLRVCEEKPCLKQSVIEWSLIGKCPYLLPDLLLQ